MLQNGKFFLPFPMPFLTVGLASLRGYTIFQPSTLMYSPFKIVPITFILVHFSTGKLFALFFLSLFCSIGLSVKCTHRFFYCRYLIIGLKLNIPSTRKSSLFPLEKFDECLLNTVALFNSSIQALFITHWD